MKNNMVKVPTQSQPTPTREDVLLLDIKEEIQSEMRSREPSKHLGYEDNDLFMDIELKILMEMGGSRHTTAAPRNPRHEDISQLFPQQWTMAAQPCTLISALQQCTHFTGTSHLYRLDKVQVLMYHVHHITQPCLMLKVKLVGSSPNDLAAHGGVVE